MPLGGGSGGGGSPSWTDHKWARKVDPSRNSEDTAQDKPPKVQQPARGATFVPSGTHETPKKQQSSWNTLLGSFLSPPTTRSPSKGNPDPTTSDKNRDADDTRTGEGLVHELVNQLEDFLESGRSVEEFIDWALEHRIAHDLVQKATQVLKSEIAKSISELQAESKTLSDLLTASEAALRPRGKQEVQEQQPQWAANLAKKMERLDKELKDMRKKGREKHESSECSSSSEPLSSSEDDASSSSSSDDERPAKHKKRDRKREHKAGRSKEAVENKDKAAKEKDRKRKRDEDDEEDEDVENKDKAAKEKDRKRKRKRDEDKDVQRRKKIKKAAHEETSKPNAGDVGAVDDELTETEAEDGGGGDGPRPSTSSASAAAAAGESSTLAQSRQQPRSSTYTNDEFLATYACNIVALGENCFKERFKFICAFLRRTNGVKGLAKTGDFGRKHMTEMMALMISKGLMLPKDSELEDSRRAHVAHCIRIHQRMMCVVLGSSKNATPGIPHYRVDVAKKPEPLERDEMSYAKTVCRQTFLDLTGSQEMADAEMKRYFGSNWIADVVMNVEKTADGSSV